MKNKALSTFLLSAASMGVSPAMANSPAPRTYDPSAVAQVLLEKIEPGRQHIFFNTRERGRSLSFLCLGNILGEPITVRDQSGQNAFSGTFTPDIIKFIQNPQTKDPDGQKRIKSLLEQRSDLAYLEYATTSAPDAKKITAYFQQAYQHTPHDVFARGTGLRDGSLLTSILIDESVMKKFITDNEDRIKTIQAQWTQAGFGHYAYSRCGPESPARRP
ncbi:MAG: hypothetical protein J0L77_01520 [Alphaproteobacteria bacterium]|nr:hypothetical protein [Alphaproteobacteria bacterium]